MANGRIFAAKGQYRIFMYTCIRAMCVDTAILQ